MEEKKNNKKLNILLVLGFFVLIGMLGGLTYAFFNYTRTGSNNTLRLGTIEFSSNYTGVTLQNVFPVRSNNLSNNDNVGEVTVTINGKTSYSGGVEYLVSLASVDNIRNNMEIPISIVTEVSAGLGSSDSSYFTNRGSTSKIYKILANTMAYNGEYIVVGYIPNDGVNTTEGTITIKAYIDGDNIAISDTYAGSESDNMGTTSDWVSGRTVITTSEWNAAISEGISFKVKVEANEGIWVVEPFMSKLARTANRTQKINFANASGSSNGQGLYLLAGTENDTYPIYYYRGALNNNNVIFGGYCWQMVRTTDTGGIKMIYNGIPDISGSGTNITYNCGTTRLFQDDVRTITSLKQSTGYFYADDYEIVSSTGNGATYRLKSATNPITQVSIADATEAASKIPTIVANYSYTCKKTTDTGTCTTLYKVDSYASETDANVYASSDISIIGNSAFNSNFQSASDLGYMSNTRYASNTSGWTNNALFAREATWVTDHYELTGASETTPDETHHYSCNATTSGATCTNLRYVYYLSGTKKYYITLTNGELIEDALYKMTGNGSGQTKQNNSNYVLNHNDSTIKGVIEIWFETNLTNVVDNTKTDYRPYLEDTVYCNDRSFKTESGSRATYEQSGWNPNISGTSGNGVLTKSLYFGSVNRLYNGWYSTSNVPTTTCPNETDRFSMSSSVAHLNYPVGLLTADEIVMAGAAGNDNTSNQTYYLYTGDLYWSLSPISHSYNSHSVFGVQTSGNLAEIYLSESNGVRPVVSLKSGIEFESGGNGTPTNPYVVKMGK